MSAAQTFGPGVVQIAPVDSARNATEAPAAEPTHRKPRTGAGARFNPDSLWIYRAVNAGVILTALAAIAISWQGLAYVASWLELPPYLAWLLPVMIDLPIVVFTLGTLARKARGESTWMLAIGAYGLTGISALANFLHIVAVRPLTTLEGIVGASLAALAPMLVLLTTEVLGTLITKPPRAETPGKKLAQAREDLAAVQKELRAIKRATNKSQKTEKESS